VPIVLSQPTPGLGGAAQAAHAVARATKSKVGKPLSLMTNPGAATTAAGAHAGHTH